VIGHLNQSQWEIIMVMHLKEALCENRLVRVFGLGQLCQPKIIEMIGYGGGYDAVWFDQEHCGLTIEQIEHSARAARAAGLDSFVRITATDYATVMRPLEAGAGGVMAAQVRSAREAAQVIHWAKFHPLGLRGVNGSGIDGRYSTLPMKEYFQKANAETFVAIQIEHVDAVAEVEQIAALQGVDVLFVGPADLSQSMGFPGEWEHPQVWQSLEKVSAAAKKHGIHWAILPPSPDYARRCVELGCRMLSLGLDVWAVNKGLRAFKTEYAEYFK
jgi:2-dehydro-3-deoxyglucarate aldolase/4-hydroxy-2-oxoheptanedioate aldolase